jgi:hypothetical protein
MAKREKIILSLMILSICLYGVYYFSAIKPSVTGIERPEKNEEKLNKFVTDIAVRLKKKDISKTDKHIIAMAKSEWAGDPFLRVALPSESQPKQEGVGASALNVNFIYSGYMAMGNIRLAVINGMEYVVGEELDPEGYIIKSISPAQVVIEIKETNQTIVLPVEEVN